MSEKTNNTAACKNTDRHLWPQVSDDVDCPKLFVTPGGGIAINVGGHVIVKPLSEWHKLARASSPAQEPITTEPVAWRYRSKKWSALLWCYQTEALVNDDFETPSYWIIEPLYAIPAPPQPGRDAVIEECAKFVERFYDVKYSDQEQTISVAKMIGEQIAAALRAIAGEQK